MKIKTAELQGAALDWAVAKCLWPEHIHKYPAWWFDQHPDGCYLWEAIDGEDSSVAAFSPHTRWSQGGEIVSQEKIAVVPCWWEGAENPDWWVAKKHSSDFHIGPTPLIAAMRCFCASRLGDEVEVPDELCN